MNRTPIAIAHRIQNSLNWYGHEYTFSYYGVNDFNEPIGTPTERQKVVGIYHSSEHTFVELLNAEGASVKAKINKGVFCGPEELTIEQGDIVVIDGTQFKVTTHEPVIYCDVVVAREISLEEVVK